MQPTPKVQRQIAGVERKIAKLREQHTKLFESQDHDPNRWLKMATVCNKIIVYYDQLHELKKGKR